MTRPVVFRVGDRVVSRDPAKHRFEVIEVRWHEDEQALRAPDDAFEAGVFGPPHWFDAWWFDLDAAPAAEQRGLFG